MPTKSIPQLGDSNWGTPLNEHINQLQNPTTGGINTFDQFSQRPTNLTADDIGKTYLYTQTGNLHQWTGTTWKVLNESVVNVKDYGAVGDGVTDDTVAVQACLDLAKLNTSKLKVFFQNGIYRITSTLNLTTNNNTLPASGSAIHIEFDRRSSLGQKNTYFLGETGSKPVIETTGSYGITLDNVAIYSGENNPSQIGILHARPASGGAFRHLYRNIVIKLKSEITANGGFGTLGLVNISAEEQMYENVDITANTCYVHSTSSNIRRLNGDYSQIINYDIESAFAIPLANAVTSTVVKFCGLGRFESLDWVGPIVLIHNPDNDFNASSIDFGNTFMIKTYPDDNSSNGIYDYAFEIFNCRFLKHFGQMEGCGRYILLHGALDHSQIDIYDTGNTPMLNAPQGYNKDPYILVWPLSNLQYTITNTKINLYNQQSSIPFIRWKDQTPTLLNSCPYIISGSTFSINNSYIKDIVGKGIYKCIKNSKIDFTDYTLILNNNSVLTHFIKEILNNLSQPTNIFTIDMPTVTSLSDISGYCVIKGTLTSSPINGSSTLLFESKFGFVRNSIGSYIGASSVSTTIIQGVSISSNTFDITGIDISLSISNDQIKVFALPQSTGTQDTIIKIIGSVEITYSDSGKEVPQIIFNNLIN